MTDDRMSTTPERLAEFFDEIDVLLDVLRLNMLLLGATGLLTAEQRANCRSVESGMQELQDCFRGAVCEGECSGV